MAKQFISSTADEPENDPIKNNLNKLALEVSAEALKPGTDLGVRMEVLKIVGAHYAAMKRVGAPLEKDGGLFDAYRKSLANGNGEGAGSGAGTSSSSSVPAGSDSDGASATPSRDNIVKLGRAIRSEPDLGDNGEGDEDTE